jgi:dTDP-4-amino-4,6-dideoxygalactose transaminase
MKLKDLDNANEKRRKVANIYFSKIKNNHIILPVEVYNNKHVWHVFAVRVSNRDHFQQYLNENGVQTVIHYPIPPHKQLAYTELADLSFPIAEKIHREVISLPISPVITMEQVQYVIDVVNNYLS